MRFPKLFLMIRFVAFDRGVNLRLSFPRVDDLPILQFDRPEKQYKELQLASQEGRLIVRGR